MNDNFRVNSLFSSNMILQRNRQVLIWGYGSDGKEVRLAFNGQAKNAVIRNGRWSIDLDPMDIVREGVPMTISCGEEIVRFDNILVGDVWIASGQSNMCFYIDYLQEPTKSAILDDYDYPQIRFFRQKELLNTLPQEEATEPRWITGKPSDIGTCPTVGALFAREIFKELNIPVGILTAAYGGERVEAFIESEILHKSGLPLLKPYTENAYNALINPLKPFSCCGMLWYQGEANCFSEEHRQYYHAYMKLLVEQFRADFRNPDMPVLQVQLPSYGMPDADYTEIRFEQMKAGTMIPRMYTTVNYDTGNPKDLHPSDKLPIGERLVNMALEKVYGKNVGNKNCYPAYDCAAVDGNCVLVTFKDVDEGLNILSSAVNGLELCGSDGVYYPAAAEIVGRNQLKVTSEKVNSPAGIRYGCKSNMIPAQFFDKNGNPVKPFRAEL